MTLFLLSAENDSNTLINNQNAECMIGTQGKCKVRNLSEFLALKMFEVKWEGVRGVVLTSNTYFNNISKTSGSEVSLQASSSKVLGTF